MLQGDPHVEWCVLSSDYYNLLLEECTPDSLPEWPKKFRHRFEVLPEKDGSDGPAMVH